MNLALDNLQRLIFHKNHSTNQPTENIIVGSIVVGISKNKRMKLKKDVFSLTFFFFPVVSTYQHFAFASL